MIQAFFMPICYVVFTLIYSLTARCSDFSCFLTFLREKWSKLRKIGVQFEWFSVISALFLKKYFIRCTFLPNSFLYAEYWGWYGLLHFPTPSLYTLIFIRKLFFIRPFIVLNWCSISCIFASEKQGWKGWFDYQVERQTR